MNSFYRINISEKIKGYRKDHRLTQEAFGKILGVSAQAISKWERTECYPDITFLPTLAKLIGCSIGDFFEESEPKKRLQMLQTEHPL